MKKLLLIISQSIMYIGSYGQCDINNILPFKTGSTQFQTSSVVNSLKIKRDESMYLTASSPFYEMYKSNGGCIHPNEWLKQPM